MPNRNFARAVRRKTQWAGSLDAAGASIFPSEVAVGGAILAQGFLIAGSSGVVDEETTITRTIGRITAQLDGVTVSSGEYGIGCIVARNEAVTAGVASLASPETDPDAEWLYYTTGHFDRPVASDDTGIATASFNFDVRGQRIVRAGSTVVWIGAARGATINVSVNPRYLLKLT